MDISNVNKNWLKEWSGTNISKGAFLVRHSCAKMCVKDIGIEPSCCIRELVTTKGCKDCWVYVWNEIQK